MTAHILDMQLGHVDAWGLLDVTYVDATGRLPFEALLGVVAVLDLGDGGVEPFPVLAGIELEVDAHLA
jgi:hypothetical protein